MRCPDCNGEMDEYGDVCPACGLRMEDVQAAADFYAELLAQVRAEADLPSPRDASYPA